MDFIKSFNAVTVLVDAANTELFRGNNSVALRNYRKAADILLEVSNNLSGQTYLDVIAHSMRLYFEAGEYTQIFNVLSQPDKAFIELKTKELKYIFDQSSIRRYKDFPAKLKKNVTDKFLKSKFNEVLVVINDNLSFFDPLEIAQIRYDCLTGLGLKDLAIKFKEDMAWLEGFNG